ncbi:aldehyde dehydrogenase family protein [Cryobacterium sp. Hh7]|uniref:aldehyde dehydrogenase family protein n=1 Tax=Cryobacterium sp. Hh7 TaxID=1259159 RepID=UPI00106CC045|nr:aldehyde dehydrogenase family protein [Cryobacterium sp. Hh7]TFD55852.1 aldehyde dehydrogenase family protein [Cryobacterium sp. Hh7]
MTTPIIGSIESIAATAAAAAPLFAATPPRARAVALVTVADLLIANADDLITIGMSETGLSEQRLRGELKRTAVQLCLFAEAIADGAYMDVRIDRRDPEFVLGVRPDLRRSLVPRGPVLNYAGSNFPFAFSVAGGDSAAALAAGCPVILKAHSGHPLLSEATAAIVIAGLTAAGMPVGTFQLVAGQAKGVALLKDDRIRAGSFTGSLRAGRLLADLAAARARPIPFFGELGSVNPVYALPSFFRSDEDAAALAAGYASSVAGSAGQLCTKPGFLFVPATSLDAVASAAASAVASVPEHRLLNSSIAAGFSARRAAILSTPGITIVASGSLRTDSEEQVWATPTIVATSAEALELAGETLLDEAFGPLSIVVGYPDESELACLAERLFPGNLTSTVYAAADDSTATLTGLFHTLAETSGRVLFGGWPTGVAVTPAMQHGGPWPATTSDNGTSVGTAAITRFLRAVAYQDMPQQLLPPELRDDNPWGVPQNIAAAGESVSWGDSFNVA